LLLIDRNLEDYQIRIEKDKRQNESLEQTINGIKEIRYDIREFLKDIGAEQKERDIFTDLKSSCTIFEYVDLADLEPNRLQEAYGKLDLPEEETRLSLFVQNIKAKLRKLGKISSKAGKIDSTRRNTRLK